jgi:hypothetical protein
MTSAKDMRPEYEKDFASGERHEIEIKEMSQIRREEAADGSEEEEEEQEWKKGIEHGLRVRLFDPTAKRGLIVNYWYRFEDGKWLHAWHEILEVVSEEDV